jgi:hypothetical protein
MRRAAVAVLGALAVAGCGDHVTALGSDVRACAAVAGDPSARLPALPADPVIDGKLDCGAAVTPLPRSTWSGKTPLPDTISAEVAIAWRPAGIYFWLHVVEPQRDPAVGAQMLFCGDTAHVFVDDDGVYPAAPMYGPTGTRQFLAAAPADAATVTRRGRIDVYPNTIGPWSQRFATFPTPDGYVLEAFITADELGVPGWRLAAGSVVGVAAAVGIGDGVRAEVAEPCPKLGDLWNRTAAQPFGQCFSAHCNTTAFWNPRLQ